MASRFFVRLVAAITVSPSLMSSGDSVSASSATPSPSARYTFDPPSGFVKHVDVSARFIQRWVRPHAVAPAFDEIVAAGEQPYSERRTLADFRKFTRERQMAPSDVLSHEVMGKTCHGTVPAYCVTITGGSRQGATFEGRSVVISREPWVFIASYARRKTLPMDAAALASQDTLCPTGSL